MPPQLSPWVSLPSVPVKLLLPVPAPAGASFLWRIFSLALALHASRPLLGWEVCVATSWDRVGHAWG